MSSKSLQPRTTALIIMILLAASFRLLQSSNVFSILSNVTPVGAIALFGGCYFQDRWKAFLVPLITLFISDVVLNRIFYFDHWTLFYPGAYWVYISFAAVVLLGMVIKKVNILTVGLAAIGGGVVHFLISDFGTWTFATDITTGLPFTKDFAGLVKCYVLGLPFLRNMVVGNLVFCGVLFGAFEWMQIKYPSLRANPISAQSVQA